MRRIAYMVLALVLTLSLGILAQPNRSDLLPYVPRAHAAALSIVLSGCVITSGSCVNVGWNGTTTKPNPTITVAQGDSVSISLSSGDGIAHEFQLDVDSDGGESSDCGTTTDPCSSSFPPGTPTFTFTVTANPGTYTYYCIFHTVQMHGTFIVNPGSTVGGVATSPIDPVTIAEYFAVVSIALIGVVSTAVYVLRQRQTNSES